MPEGDWPRPVVHWEIQARDPEKLRAFDVPVMRVVEAIGEHNADVGARVIEMGGREYMIRGLGYLRTLDEIRNVAVGATMNGTPIRVADVANVVAGLPSKEFWSPGSTLRVRFDTANPIAFGMPSEGWALFMAGSQVYEVTSTDRSQDVG